MKKYEVEINFTYSGIERIEANNSQEAIALAEQILFEGKSPRHFEAKVLELTSG